jgi:polar amino acid transport system permease protein
MHIFDFSVFANLKAITYVLEGTGYTLLLTLIAIGIGFLIGSLLAFGEVYLPPLYSYPFRAVGEILRGIPLLVLFLLLYFGLKMSALTSAIVGLGIRSAAYQGQIFRSSLEAVSLGQLQAALSVGMSKFQVFREILLPQAMRIMIPSWSNEFITVLKDTSIAFILGITDIMTRADLIARSVGRYLEIYIFIAVVYFVLVRISTSILNSIYERKRIPGLGEKR